MSYALVTGASSGIGYAFVKELSKKGYDIIMVSRNKEKLEKIKKELPTNSIILSHDLSRKEECYRLLYEIEDYDIDYFINNAGFGDYKAFKDIDDTKLENMIDVNVSAVSILTKGILNRFVSLNKGSIINVASSAGLLPAGPYMSLYYATKAFVTSLTLGISVELKQAKSNVYIGALCPGPVDTMFNNVAGVEFSLKGISKEICVSYALKKASKKKVIIVPSKKLNIALFFSRFVNRGLLANICAHQQKKKGSL